MFCSWSLTSNTKVPKEMVLREIESEESPKREREREKEKSVEVRERHKARQTRVFVFLHVVFLLRFHTHPPTTKKTPLTSSEACR